MSRNRRNDQIPKVIISRDFVVSRHNSCTIPPILAQFHQAERSRQEARREKCTCLKCIIPMILLGPAGSTFLKRVMRFCEKKVTMGRLAELLSELKIVISLNSPIHFEDFVVTDKVDSQFTRIC